MNRDEADYCVETVIARWPVGDWSTEQILAYTDSMQTLPFDLTMQALDIAVKETKYRPSIAELYELVRSIRRGQPKPPEPEPPVEERGIPHFVKRWVAARWLYEKFGRAQDMRPFPEQAEYANPDLERMPDGEWETEAAEISEVDVWAAIGADRGR